MAKIKFVKRPHDSRTKIAVLIDGTFFLKRYRVVYQNGKNHTAAQIVKNLYNIAMRHVGDSSLYRIFYYDCNPLEKTVCNPISKKNLTFSNTKQYRDRIELFNTLRRQRKVALRLGELKDFDQWIIRPQITEKILNKKISTDELTENDIAFRMQQKGVDIKIGIDISTMAYKNLVDQIVLISGDSDFVDAAKLARREGIDFILDPMWNHIRENLTEHIDGLQSYCPNPNKSKTHNISSSNLSKNPQ